ncbi:hypothetical protein QFC22_005628 [Naganishia vaughanmartiniae]|uniref:Uncharacterized protein n=1 Tax=Naganishia vaughanmartiniae TaxID=1424756 RepID=A0ACC2WW35_9TREE|nr:hypothetical protein QFC22_005628 [Naganishia vaughanmartiniae]
MIDSLPTGPTDLAYSVALAVAESALDDHPSLTATGKMTNGMYLYDNTAITNNIDIHMDTPQRTSRRDSSRDLPKPSKGTASPWNCKPFSMIPSPSSRTSSPVTTQTFTTTTATVPVTAPVGEARTNDPVLPPGLFATADKEPRNMRATAPVFSCRSSSAGKTHVRSQSELLPSAQISSPHRSTTVPQPHAPGDSQRYLGRPTYHRATASVAGVPRDKEEGMLPFPRDVLATTSRISFPSGTTSTLAATTHATSHGAAAAADKSIPAPRGRAGLPTLAEITAHYRAQGRTHSVTVSELQEIASPPLTSSPLPDTHASRAPASSTVEEKVSSPAMIKRYSLESNDSYGSSQSYTSRSSADDTDSGMPTTPPPCDIMAFDISAKAMPSSTGVNGESRLPSFLRDRASPNVRKYSSPAPATSTSSTNSTLAKALAKHRRRAVSQYTASSPAPGSTSPGHARRTGSMDSYPMVGTPSARSILGIGPATPMVQVTPPSTKIPSSATFTATSRLDNGNASGDEFNQSATRRWPRSMRPSASSGHTMMQQINDERSCPPVASKFLSTGSPATTATRPQVTTTTLPIAPMISFTPPTAPPAKADSSTCAEFEALVVDARVRRTGPQSRTQTPRSPLTNHHNTGRGRDGKDKDEEDNLRRQRAERMMSALGKRRTDVHSASSAGPRTGVVMGL